MTQTVSAHVAAEVRANLARQNKTAGDLAAQLGVSQMWVSRRLRGKVPFDVDEVTAVAAFLAVPVDSLLKDAS